MSQPSFFSYDSSEDNFRQLTEMKEFDLTGRAVFAVYALDMPGERAFPIGEVRATSKFHTSDFGDRGLFFRHTTTEEGIASRPQFGEVCPPGSTKTACVLLLGIGGVFHLPSCMLAMLFVSSFPESMSERMYAANGRLWE